ncbi:MAG: rubrerythrin family protein [Candidatus Omnitrophica bacterium]|nr:rubrerythrin family protein [Candidatus Omnitrophota bacterium]
MKSIKNSQTEKNLLAAFAGESQARNRYTFFAKQAEKEGYQQIGAIFLETAENEAVHAKTFFKFLEGGEVEITASYPAGIIGKTSDNLREAAAGENAEWTTLYKQAAETAEKEGYEKVAETFREIAKVEYQHEMRYKKLLSNIDNDTVFKKSAAVKWKCRKCGYIHEDTTAPQICPACKHPQSYYEIKAENY